MEKILFHAHKKDTHTHINKNFFIILNRVSILPTLFGIFGMLRWFRGQRYCFSLICAKFILVHFRFAQRIAYGE